MTLSATRSVAASALSLTQAQHWWPRNSVPDNRADRIPGSPLAIIISSAAARDEFAAESADSAKSQIVIVSIGFGMRNAAQSERIGFLLNNATVGVTRRQ